MLIHKSEKIKLLSCMIGFINYSHLGLHISMKNKGKEFLKDSAQWVIIFGVLYLLVFYNYVEVKGILNHKFN